MPPTAPSGYGGSARQSPSRIHIHQLRDADVHKGEAGRVGQAARETLAERRKRLKQAQAKQPPTGLEKSHQAKNYPAFAEFERKQEFYHVAKQNRRVSRDSDQTFLKSCTTMQVTPLPAFCRAEFSSIGRAVALAATLRGGTGAEAGGAASGGKPTSVTSGSPGSSPRRDSESDQSPRSKAPQKQEPTKGFVGEELPMLSLMHYQLSDEIARAMGQKLAEQHQGAAAWLGGAATSPGSAARLGALAGHPETPSLPGQLRQPAKVAILDSNGLSDLGLSYILEGLRRPGQLESLNISKNEFGPLSLAVLRQILQPSWPEPRQLAELRLQHLFFTKRAVLQELLAILGEDGADFATMRVLKLAEINISELDVTERQRINPLPAFLAAAPALFELNLAAAGL